MLKKLEMTRKRYRIFKFFEIIVTTEQWFFLFFFLSDSDPEIDELYTKIMDYNYIIFSIY